MTCLNFSCIILCVEVIFDFNTKMYGIEWGYFLIDTFSYDMNIKSYINVSMMVASIRDNKKREYSVEERI